MHLISAGMRSLRFYTCFFMFPSKPCNSPSKTEKFLAESKPALQHVLNPQMEYRVSTQSITTSEFQNMCTVRPKAFLFWVRCINIAKSAIVP